MTTKWPVLAIHSERTSSKYTELRHLYDWQPPGCKVEWTAAVGLTLTEYIVNYGQRRDKFSSTRKQISFVMVASGFCKVIYRAQIWTGQEFRILSGTSPNISKFLTSNPPLYCVATQFLPHYTTAVQIPECNGSEIIQRNKSSCINSPTKRYGFSCSCY